ncbi:unnamed protein product, partial [Durusdinium trenchii]
SGQKAESTPAASARASNTCFLSQDALEGLSPRRHGLNTSNMPQRGLFSIFLEAFGEAHRELHQDLLKLDGCGCYPKMSDLARCCGKRDWNNALEKVRESIEDTKAAMQQSFTMQKGKPGMHVEEVYNGPAQEALKKLEDVEQDLQGG